MPIEVTQPSEREVRVVRTFNAPRTLVWDAHTKPDLVPRWMGGLPGWSMPVCEMDVRVGGAYRWRFRLDAEGKEFGFFGEFIEVTKPSKLVHRETYDAGDFDFAMTAEPTEVTTTFEEKDGVTTLTVNIVYASKAARDAAVSTGMTDGMEISYGRLDALVAQQERV